MTETPALYQNHPRRIDIPAGIAISLALLVAGQLLPILTIDTLGPSRSTYSIVGGIVGLVENRNLLLALILLVFSVIFPVVKLLALAWLWFRKLEPDRRSSSIQWLKKLGKWSMLDVFVVVVLAGSVQLGLLAETRVELGVYVFSAAIVLSLIVTFLMARLAEPPGSASRPTRTFRKPSRLEIALPALALALFIAGLCFPILHVEEWAFWSQDYSLLSGTWSLFQDGEIFLALLVLVFVILLPLAGLACLLLLYVLARNPETMERGKGALRHLSRWCMIDVFGLAVLIVVAKIGGLADVEPRPGLWLLGGAALISPYLSWRLDLEADS